MNDFSIKLLLVTNVILLVILLVTFIYLLVRKQKSIKQQERKHKLKQKIRPSLYQYLNDGTVINTRLIQPDDSTSYQAVEELLREYQTITSSESISQRIKEFTEQYFKEYYMSLLAQRRWSIRMNTLYSIERFNMDSFKNIILRKFQKEDYLSEEKQQMARVLATFQSKDLIKDLFNKESKYPLFLYKEILRRYEPSLFDVIVKEYDDADALLKIAILSLFAEKKDTSYMPLVDRELENAELDIRLQALKVIRNIGYIKDIGRLIPFARSSQWQERMLFCQIAMVIKKERFKPLLVELIGDDNWWARNAAGEAIRKYKEGKYILEHITKTHEDLFARDMARKWLGSD